MNIWHDNLWKTGKKNKEYMPRFHQKILVQAAEKECWPLLITILKCSNSLPSSASKSFTDGSTLSGEGKFPASSTYSICGVNYVTMQMLKLIRKHCQENKYAFTSTNNFNYLILVPAQIYLHEYIRVVAHGEKLPCS